MVDIPQRVGDVHTTQKRLPTGVAGLDFILDGGLFRGGIYMVCGQPGAGKTILGNQACFHHVAQGGRASYLTLLTESHPRMMASLQDLSYFDSAPLGDAMQYIGAYQALENQGFDGLLTLVRQQVRAQGSSLIVIDGLVTAINYASADLDVKRFLHELQILLELMDCTALLLTGEMTDQDHYPLRTMVDGLILLSTHRVGMRATRIIEVTKHRGAGQLMGKSCFDIGQDGITVYPRFEAVNAEGRGPQDAPQRHITSGSPALDAVLGGGIAAGTSALLIGPPGAGKSVLGLSFLLAGAAAGERSLYVGPGLGGPLAATIAQAVASGDLLIYPAPNQEQSIDRYLMRLESIICAQQIRRIFIGDATQLRAAMVFAGRSPDVFRAMHRMLQRHGVTALIAESHSVESGIRLEVPPTDVGAMAQTLILMRYMEVDGRYQRYLAVVETPGFVHDDRVFTYKVMPTGIAFTADPDQAREQTLG